MSKPQLECVILGSEEAGAPKLDAYLGTAARCTVLSPL